MASPPAWTNSAGEEYHPFLREEVAAAAAAAAAVKALKSAGKSAGVDNIPAEF